MSWSLSPLRTVCPSGPLGWRSVEASRRTLGWRALERKAQGLGSLSSASGVFWGHGASPHAGLQTTCSEPKAVSDWAHSLQTELSTSERL